MKILLLVIILVAGGYFILNKPTSKKGLCPLNQNNILTLGDSLANGFGVNENDSFAMLIPSQLNKKAIKSGVNGETTSGLLSRIDSTLNQANDIAAIVISIGGNDVLRNIDKNLIKNNLDIIVKKAKTKTNCVVLLGVPGGVIGGLAGSVASFYKDIGEKYDILVESKSMPQILKDTSLRVDQIHPNKNGHQIIANNITTLIQKNK